MLLLYSSIGLASAQADESQQQYPAIDSNVRYSAIADLPAREHDELLNYGSDAEQVVRVWRPTVNDVTDKFKGVVALIHGGCWLSQFDYAHTKALSTALSNNGYLVWNIEYRRAGNGGEWPLALEDINAALGKLSWLSQNAVDDSTIFIVGHSAGGHLAYLAGAQAADLFALNRQRVKVIGVGAIIDVHAYARGENSCQTATPLFMNAMPEERPDQYHIASPLSYRFNTNSQLSFTLLHGSLDTIVPLTQGQHPDVRQLVIEGAAHFDWIHPGSPAFKHLLEALSR